MAGNGKQNGELPQHFDLGKDITYLFSQVVVESLVDQGIKHFVVCPGMRNVPIIQALIKHPQMTVTSIIDERSAGFVALGLIKSKGHAVGVCTTSGSACANLFPAVIEARKTGLPLTIISADRPFELSKYDSNQTIKQPGIFGDFAPVTLNLEGPNEKTDALSVYQLIARSQASAIRTNSPFHLNIPFREPLDGSGDIAPISFFRRFITFNRFSDLGATKSVADHKVIDQITKSISKAKRPLLVIGALNKVENKDLWKDFIHSFPGPRFLDVTSKLKYLLPISKRAIPTWDHPELYAEMQNNVPDLIIHIGGRLTSKNYYKFLKENPHIDLFHVQDNAYESDPALRDNFYYIISPEVLVNQLYPELKDINKEIWEGDYLSFGQRKSDLIYDTKDLNYPSISKTVIDHIPSDENLFIGNSTIIRAFDNYVDQKLEKNINIFTQRGASGIEGNISTTIGLSIGLEKAPTIILGDISAWHDLNAFLQLKHLKIDMRVIIINNFGGGIFNLLPIKDNKDVIDYIVCPHTVKFKDVLSGLNFTIKTIKTNKELKEIISCPVSQGIEVIEALVDDEYNQTIYQKLKTVKYVE